MGLTLAQVFVDGDIACPIPHCPESMIGGFDWFLILLRCARIISRSYTSLFCIGVGNMSTSYYLHTMSQLCQEVETWRESIPDNGFRPGGDVGPHHVQGAVERQVAIFLHYHYANIRLTISRARLHHLRKSKEPSANAEGKEASKQILDTSRSILELTSLIEVEPYTNLW